MNLSKYQRMVLINQFRILSKLYPDEARDYENKIKVLEFGFSRNYEWLMPLDNDMPEEACAEVFDILDMFRSIHDSVKKDGNLSDDERQSLKFRGFDGNEEPSQYAYARYLMLDEERYSELARECADEFLNSHIPVLDMYRRMLAKWREFGSPRGMDVDILRQLNNARRA